MANKFEKSSKLGLILGSLFIGFLLIGGGAAFWVFNQGTDNRSQASADHVAQIKVTSQKRSNNSENFDVTVDTSQLKAGTTVTEFTGLIFFPNSRVIFGEDKQVLGETTAAVETVTSGSAAGSAPSAGGTSAIKVIPSSVVPNPSGITVTAQPMPPISDSCLTDRNCSNGYICVGSKIETTCPPGAAGAVCSLIANGRSGKCVPKPVTPTSTPPVNVTGPIVITGIPVPTAVTTSAPIPTTTISKLITKSSDGLLTVYGINSFAKISNLKVTAEKNFDGYLVTISGQADPKDLEIQRSFSGAKPLFSISTSEKTKVLGFTPVMRRTSIKGFLPGMNIATELTMSLTPSGISKPTAKPPVKVTLVPPAKITPTLAPRMTPVPLPTTIGKVTCRTSANCPQGYLCALPPVADCRPNMKCIMPDRVGVCAKVNLLPKPTLDKSKVDPVVISN